VARRITDAEWNAHLSHFSPEEAEEIVTRKLESEHPWTIREAYAYSGRKAFGVGRAQREGSHKVYAPTRRPPPPEPREPIMRPSALHSFLANRALSWGLVLLATASGLGELAAVWTNAGFPRWGQAILLLSLTAAAILQSATASLNKAVSLVAVAQNLGMSVATTGATLVRASARPPPPFLASLIPAPHDADTPVERIKPLVPPLPPPDKPKDP
jgi:hypothetical protein